MIVRTAVKKFPPSTALDEPHVPLNYMTDSPEGTLIRVEKDTDGTLWVCFYKEVDGTRTNPG